MESEAKPFVSVPLYRKEMSHGVSNVIKVIFHSCASNKNVNVGAFRKWRARPSPFSTVPVEALMAVAACFTLLLVLIRAITPFVFLTIPFWRLYSIYGGYSGLLAIAGGGKHGGLPGSGGGGGENSQGGSLKMALVIFYWLVAWQGLMELYLILSTLATQKPYFMRLRQEYNFPADWGAEALRRYLRDTVENCKRSPASIRDSNLFRHASELLGSEAWEDYVDGLRVLGILVRQGLLSGSSQSYVVASRPKVDRLIDTLGDVDARSSEARELAATVVAGLANRLQLARFPGAIQCVASLLETTTHGGGEAAGATATAASSNYELVLQGLTILDRLALDHHNCREICSVPGLLPRITAPLYSHTLIQGVIGMPPRARLVSKSMRVVHRLIRAPGETAATLRRQICADEQAVSNIEGILGLAMADHAAAGGEQAQLATKRTRSADMHMETRSAGLPLPTYEEASKASFLFFNVFPACSVPCIHPFFNLYVMYWIRAQRMQMIVQALTEMRDPSGSSRRTISMYIADHFSGLDDDDELLSYNLDRLVSLGHLRRVGGNYFLERSVEHEKTLGDLQMLGMEILTELALDPSLNLSETTKQNLITTQLRIFLACKKGTEPVTKVQTSGRTLALLLHCCPPNSLPITDLNDNICHLTRILDDKNNKIMYRTIAAWILEGLCAYHDIDYHLLKATVLPKVSPSSVQEQYIN